MKDNTKLIEAVQRDQPEQRADWAIYRPLQALRL